MPKIKLIPFLMLPLLMNCAPNGQESDFCQKNSAIYASKQDKITGQTARQIDAYDDYGQALCGWLPASH